MIYFETSPDWQKFYIHYMMDVGFKHFSLNNGIESINLHSVFIKILFYIRNLYLSSYFYCRIIPIALPAMIPCYQFHKNFFL